MNLRELCATKSMVCAGGATHMGEGGCGQIGGLVALSMSEDGKNGRVRCPKCGREWDAQVSMCNSGPMTRENERAE